MYPHGDLTDLERHRRRLQERIALRRRLCVLQVRQAAVPLERFDRLRAQWKRLAPAAGLMAWPLLRKATPKFALLRMTLKFAPIALSWWRARRNGAANQRFNPRSVAP